MAIKAGSKSSSGNGKVFSEAHYLAGGQKQLHSDQTRERIGRVPRGYVTVQGVVPLLPGLALCWVRLSPPQRPGGNRKARVMPLKAPRESCSEAHMLAASSRNPFRNQSNRCNQRGPLRNSRRKWMCHVMTRTFYNLDLKSTTTEKAGFCCFNR